MTAFEEEIFGPVWSVTAFRTREEAIELANASRYGLGASVWSDDETLIERMIAKIDTGNVFINDFVRSDPRLPFGGVKSSGYGKDLGEEGFTEFVNWKTVYWKA
jgi:succinate-semialdehyde dehydrogenase/glutarate-semialdehyde dehydrogenase